MKPMRRRAVAGDSRARHWMVAAEFKQVNFQRPECALYVQSLVYVKYRQGLVAAQPPRAIARRATRSDRPTIDSFVPERCQVNAFETAGY